MRILILGASGMLGHKLWKSLSVRFPKTYAVIRGSRDDYKKFNLFKNEGQVIEKIDALNFPDLEKVLDDFYNLRAESEAISCAKTSAKIFSSLGRDIISENLARLPP